MAATASAFPCLQSSANLLNSRSSSSSTKLGCSRRSNLVLANSRTRQRLQLTLPETEIALHRYRSYGVIQALESSSMENLASEKAAARDTQGNLDGNEQEIISNTEDGEDIELEKGYEMTSVCDRLIDVFMIEKPNTSDWRKLLAFSKEWTNIRPHFFKWCRVRVDVANDPENKQNLLRLIRKLKEVKDILFHLYMVARQNLQKQVPKEVRIIKHLLTIEDPELRLTTLAQAFTPGDEIQGKDVDVLYTTPKELYHWIQTVLDAFYMSKQGTLIKEARKLMNPMVIQRLEILKGVVEEKFM